MKEASYEDSFEVHRAGYILAGAASILDFLITSILWPRTIAPPPRLVRRARRSVCFAVSLHFPLPVSLWGKYGSGLIAARAADVQIILSRFHRP